jgi:glutamine amidotransferase
VTGVAGSGEAPRVVLLDSGGANLGSVQAALARLGVDAPVSHDPGRIAEATHLVLPGVVPRPRRWRACATTDSRP